jgi:alkylated DNA repair dioxygenase AlkB
MYYNNMAVVRKFPLSLYLMTLTNEPLKLDMLNLAQRQINVPMRCIGNVVWRDDYKNDDVAKLPGYIQ